MASCDELTYTLNGADLSDPELGFQLLTGTEYAPAVAPRNATILVPRYHGAVPNYTAPLAPILVTLIVRVLGPNTTTLRENHNRLMALLGAGTQAPVAITRVRDGRVDTAEARLVSTTAPTFSAANRWIDVTIVMEIQRGYWSGPMQEVELSPNGSNQTFQPALDSAAPLAGMLIQVIGPATIVNISDAVTGTGVRWGSEPVSAAQSLLIDTGSMLAWRRTGTPWTPGTSGQLVLRWLTSTGAGVLAPRAANSYVPGTGWQATSALNIITNGSTSATRVLIRASPAVF